MTHPRPCPKCSGRMYVREVREEPHRTVYIYECKKCGYRMRVEVWKEIHAPWKPPPYRRVV